VALTRDDEVELHARSRLRLTVVLVVLALGAVLSTVTTLAYGGGSPVVPVLLWAGVGCLLLARSSVPRSTRDSAARRRSATWVVLAVLLYVVAPLLVSRLL
jgi:hypothetical protein